MGTVNTLNENHTVSELKKLATLQPLAYFKKFESILISNLLAELHKANREKKRGLDYYMTFQVLCHVNVKPVLEQVFFLGDLIEVKEKYKIRKARKQTLITKSSV